MNINIQVAKYSEKHLLRNMLELYAYDLSIFENKDLNEFGEYGYRYLDLYWIESKRHPFIIKVNGKLAGFILINKFAYTEDAEWTVAEFFVLKKYRDRGIGKKSAFYVFDRFPGKWEVRTLNKNLVAKKFWRKTIQQYAPQSMKEFEQGFSDWKHPLWTFISPKAKSN